MELIRTLIVDDEPLVREGLRTALADDSGIAVVGESGDGPDAVASIDRLAPDLVFLDIQLPGFDGFEVLRRIGVSNPPAVIFVTAYDEYALQAFDAHAVDYLLKPFDDERIAFAVERARTLVRARRSGDVERDLAGLMEDIRPYDSPRRRLAVRTGRRTVLLDAADIEHIEAAGNYVKIHANGASHLARDTLKALDHRLDARRFVRIHRSSIVNIDFVRETRETTGEYHLVILRDGTELRASARGWQRFEEILDATL